MKGKVSLLLFLLAFSCSIAVVAVVWSDLWDNPYYYYPWGRGYYYSGYYSGYLNSTQICYMKPLDDRHVSLIFFVFSGPVVQAIKK